MPSPFQSILQRLWLFEMKYLHRQDLSTVELTRAGLQSAPVNLDVAPLDSGDVLGTFDLDAFLNQHDSENEDYPPQGTDVKQLNSKPVSGRDVHPNYHIEKPLERLSSLNSPPFNMEPAFPAPDQGGLMVDNMTDFELDPDEESDVNSIFSEVTVSSQTSWSSKSTGELGTAIDEVVTILITDSVLSALFTLAASEESTITAVEFETALKKGVRKLAERLDKEAENSLQSATIGFISRGAGYIASKVKRVHFSTWAEIKIPFQSTEHGKRTMLNRYLEGYAPAPPTAREADESDNEDADGPYGGPSDIHTLQTVIEFVKSSCALQRLRETFQEVVNGSLLGWPTVEHHWKKELGEVLPCQLRVLSHDEIRFLHLDPITMGDKLKSAFEAYSGEKWDWWPLQPPRKPLQPGRVRLKWISVSVSSWNFHIVRDTHFD